jgi:ribosome biogenesis GTPase
VRQKATGESPGLSRQPVFHRPLNAYRAAVRDDLVPLGWQPADEDAIAAAGALKGPVARVAQVDRGWCTVWLGGGRDARPQMARKADVAAGDWVVLDAAAERIERVLPRRSAFVRRAAGNAAQAHVVAANVDVVALLHPLTAAPNLRRVERELVLAFQSGAHPVVVLTKADLADDAFVAAARATLDPVRAGAPVVAISARQGLGVEQVRSLVTGGETLAFVGSSGSGKSTLVNALVGESLQRVADVRAGDQRGRHTTTAARLIRLPGPNGGLLVDTPGLRSVGLWEGSHGLDQAFGDVTSLADHCRFGNCRHEREPGCAVLDAVEEGTLDPARFDAYRHLRDELDQLVHDRRS